MFRSVLLAASLSAVFADPQLFLEWKKSFGKQYASTEE
jgi:hypothetical protein